MGSRLEKGSNAVRKRIENHTFDHEEGEEYEGSTFGGFADYMRRKKLKLQNLDANLRLQSTDKPQIFRGIVAHVNGYTQPSLNDLHRLVVQHGGGFLQYLDGKTTVTHIIASNLTPKKAVEFKRYRIVKPAWIVDSVDAGKLLPWDAYRVLDEGAGQRVLGFSDGKVVNEKSTQTRGYKQQTDTSWYTAQLRGTQARSSRPLFLTQAPKLDHTDDISDVDGSDEEPGSVNSDSQAPDHAHQSAQMDTLLSPDSSPSVHQTPRLIRDLRQWDAGQESSDKIPAGRRSGVQSPGSLVSSELLCNSSLSRNGSADVEQAARTGDLSRISVVEDVEMDVAEKDVVEKDFVEKAFQQPNIDPKDGERAANSYKRSRGNDETLPAKRTKLTAEEHNELLLADPRMRKSSVVNPDFLEQYYRESRLHHLSTWKADLKSQLQAMAEEKSASQKARQKRDRKARRYIMHVDFDSFFAAVSIKKAPQFKDKPTVVAHGGGNGSEIASCNYPARKFGVSNGMWMSRAKELCPDLTVLPYDFPAYEDASRAFYEAIIGTGGLVQSVSIDEALVDISNLCFAAVGGDGIKRHEGTVYREQEAADRLARELREEVKQKTGCDVSVGIGGNILQAKVALRKAKPAGQYQLRPEDVLEFMGGLDVITLPGVAYSLAGKLEELGIKIVKDIREFTKERLMNHMGPKTGERLWEYARGIDRKEVGDVEVRKSVSAEVNWGVRFYNQEQVDEFILNLCGELTKRLIKERVKGKQLSLKVMKRSADAPIDPPKHLGHGKCDTFNKSVLLGLPTAERDILAKEALSMLKALNISPGELRGIGVQMTRLEAVKSNTRQGESSQRRLAFKFNQPRISPVDQLDRSVEDPIEEFETPEKPKAPPDGGIVVAQNLFQSSPSKKSLNTYGTQFILPSQVDPDVLAELPADIREKLEQHIQGFQKTTSFPQATPKVFTALPAASQLDPDILNSLPDDVRAEVLAFYDKSTLRPRHGGQAVLPQSPRKNRVAQPLKRLGPPTNRRRGRPGRFEVRSNIGNGTLTQSNFIAARGNDGLHTDTEGDDQEADGSEGMDSEFLAALPEDIRREVLEEQRRKRLAKISGIQISAAAKRRQAAAKQQQGPIERLLKLPARDPKPTFTGRKISSVPELRDAITTWCQEFCEEGPYEEDTDALVNYLHRVVVDEGDMHKAATAVKWLAWTIEEDLGDGGHAISAWSAALNAVTAGVQKAVKERGLGALRL